MKLLILTFAYLWKDTWHRWFEQPGSPFAKGLIATILTFTSGLIIVSFSLQEKTLRLRLEKMGMNNIVMTKLVSFPESQNLPINYIEGYLNPLNEYGDLISFTQIPQRAKKNNATTYTVLCVPDQTKYMLKDYPFEKEAFIFVSDVIPEGQYVSLFIDDLKVQAFVCKKHESLRALGVDELLLIPDQWASHFAQSGYIKKIIFRNNEQSKLEAITHLIKNICNEPLLKNLQVISPLHLKKELDTLMSISSRWKYGLAILLSVVLAIVSGTISILEYRQNLYVYALFRSMGLSSFSLFLRHLIENLFIANIAACIALLTASFLHNLFFSTFGFSSQISKSIPYLIYFNHENSILFIAVSIGALLGGIPLLFGLFKPIGKILE